MNLGVTLKAAEKVFGPALPGRGTEENTLSAVRYAKGGAKKYAGVPGFQEEAKFFIHFPTPVDWSLLASKKGTPDFISDLRESGPQGEQGRETLVAEFFQNQEALREKLRIKRENAKAATAKAAAKKEATEAKTKEAATKKEAAAEKARKKTEEAEIKAREKEQQAAEKTRIAEAKKRELEEARRRLIPYVGAKEIVVTLGSETLTLPVKITVDKSGKVKITTTL